MTTKTAHIYFLLDVSGSMEPIVDDVIGGFNQFRQEQLSNEVRTLMTLVEFDSRDRHHVIADAQEIQSVPALTRDTYRPNGGTPLFDAIGALITDATIRSEKVENNEEILFVVFTDGEENASSEYTKDGVFRLISSRQEQGWTFVFMGANQDSYAEGGRIGFDARSTQDFEFSRDGTQAAFMSLGKGMKKEIGKMGRMQRRNVRDFFEGDKEAEEQMRKPD